MANAIFNNVKISGMSCAVPQRRVTTESYTKVFSEDEVRKFIDMVGVKGRYVAIDKQTGSDLCFAAARELLAKKNIEAETIDAVIYMSQVPDYKEPSTAFVLHKRLNLRQDCLAFDINLGCTGFLNGVTVMASFINSGLVNRGLLLVGEVSKADKNTKDHTNAMMFGDAGAACLFEKAEGTVYSLLKADGKGFNIMGIPGGQARHPLDKEHPDWDSIEPHMDGFETFRFAITKAPAVWKDFSKIYDKKIDDFDYVMFHQSNKFMIDHIAAKMKLPKEKYPLSIDRFGNTNGVSIPITIVDLCERETVPDKMNLLCIAFGVGLSWGAISFEIQKDAVLPMIYSDEYDEEAYSIIFGKGKES